MNDTSRDKLQDIEIEQRVIPNENRGKVVPPKYDYGASSASGHMPDPEVDDNAYEMANEPGLYTEAEPDEPHELDVAEEVAEAERARRGL